MTALFDDFESLKRKVAKLQKEADMAAGELRQIKSTLKKEFGVTTLKEGKAKLEEMRKKSSELVNKYITKKKEFEEKWKHLLNPE